MAIFVGGKVALQHTAAIHQQRDVQLAAVEDTKLTPNDIRRQFPVLRMLGTMAIWLQRLLRPKGAALDLYAAFKFDLYNLRLTGRVIDGARIRES